MSELSQEEYKNLKNNLENNINYEKNEKNNNKKPSHYSRFLLQLYKILEEDKYKDIIHWGDNGKYFVIENVHDFTEKILPKYYNHNNYSSFVRQLNMYDFHKKKSNSEGHHIFQHNNFIKGQKELIKTILRKRKKDKNKNITSLIPFNTELVKYNQNYLLNDLHNNYNNKIEKKEIIPSDKHSLSLDEEKDNNTQFNQFNVDNIEQSLIEYNKKNFLSPSINDQLAAIKLKQNLIGNNNNDKININYNLNNNNINNVNINNNKKITKKTIYDLLNCLINNVEDNSKKQEKINEKIDSLSNKYLEYINKNNALLDEIKSKIDYNKKFETVVCFILEIQKIKNEGSLKNILISNDINNNHIQENQNDLNNLEIINLAEPKKEINGIVPANDFLQKKTYGIMEPFQSFLNKYMEKNKNRGLLTNSENNTNIIKNETINEDNNKSNKNDNNTNLILKNGSPNKYDNKGKDKDKNIETGKDLNNSIFKYNNLENHKNRSPSFDFNSSIFKRKRSSSFNSLYSNNTNFNNFNNFNDNFNNNDFIFKKDSINDNNIFCNNNQNNTNDINNFNSNNLNKSFELDFTQEKNLERKDSLNNSGISYLDLGANKTYKINDIFGGDNNSINFT